MTILDLIGLGSDHRTAAVIVAIAAFVIPALSALATKAPSWSTGFVTIVLAGITGFVAEAAKAGDGYDWKRSAAATLASVGIALIAQLQLWGRTAVADWLHNHGNAPTPANGA